MSVMGLHVQKDFNGYQNKKPKKKSPLVAISNIREEYLNFEKKNKKHTCVSLINIFNKIKFVMILYDR